MNIKKVPISDVEVWDKNPRNIKTADFKRLKRQIEELGVYKPLLCYRENGRYVTLGGNMRLRALKEMEFQEIEISIVTPKSEADKIKYALSDNDRAGEYDEQALAELTYPHIEEIQLEDFKLDIGQPISLKDVIEDYAPDTEGEDEVPEIDDSPAITKLGDLFTLGRHRLLCGDATKEEDVKRLMDREKAKLCHTDPPYGVDYANVLGGRENQKEGGWKDIKNDALKDNELEKFIHNALSKIDAPVLFLWHSWRRIEYVLNAIKRSGWSPNCEIIWVKNALVFGRSDYQWRHEYCIYAKRNGAGKQDNRKQTTVWEFNKTVGAVHPTQKPVGLFEIPIRNHTNKNDICYEPFAGSGSQIIACEKLNRICYGMDLDPKYCDVIITRYANFTETPEEEIRATRE